MSVLATVFLHGKIKRPLGHPYELGHYIECDWCGVRSVLPKALPEGWRALGSGDDARYCCHACAALEFPDE